MDIDLLINKMDDVGLVTTGKFESPVTAAIIDHESFEMSLEFAKTLDSIVLNIPVSEDLIPYLIQRSRLFVIGTDGEHIHEAYSIPLMHVNNLKDNNVGEWV